MAMPSERFTAPNAARGVSLILGIVFLIVAIWGFIAGDNVLGVFKVNAMHNLVHLVSGALLLAVAFASEHAARLTCWILAAVYAVVMLVGFFNVEAVTDYLAINMADNWLHLLLAIVLAGGAAVSIGQERAKAHAITPGAPQH